MRVRPAAKSTALLEDVDLVYRTLCAILFNFVPNSGHPGGSVSSGRIAAALVFEGMDYDLADPDRPDADRLCYAAGHKALGLYSLWALRNELARLGKPSLLPGPRQQLRLEDLLGFRRNPTQDTTLFRRFGAKALDGHPTPATPFVAIATGASGVGLGASLGLALGATDAYVRAPRIHILEGEGGLTPGRAHEALSAAATMGLENAVLHVDWNQSSIDSDRVTGEGAAPGDYVPWDPLELLQLHDWNVVDAGDGHDLARVLAAQRAALQLRNGQPTAIVYRTQKGWRYGINGRRSHGAGHAFCSEEFYNALAPFEKRFGAVFPRFAGEQTPERVERAYWDMLLIVRGVLAAQPGLCAAAAQKLAAAQKRLQGHRRRLKSGGPKLEKLYSSALRPELTPKELALEAGKPATLRGALGKAMGRLNTLTEGAFLACAADLLESTSVSELNAGFDKGFWHARRNPGSRLLAVGGICEDAMGAYMSGLSAFGRHVGVSSSYAAFIGALEHVPARLHCIGQQARRSVSGEAMKTWIMVNAHAGPKTGEDGSTHADPQALQLLQNNFPDGALVTLTPWDPAEVWPLLVRALLARPAVLAPFVSRPAERVVDRAALRLPPAAAAAEGVYALRRADTSRTVVLQGSGVGNAFVSYVLPKLDEERVRVNVFYVASAELFDLLGEERRRKVFPPELMTQAMGITDFTLATMHRWIRSEEGLRASLHPFKKSGYLGSGSGERVLTEGGLDGASQLAAIWAWVTADTYETMS